MRILSRTSRFAACVVLSVCFSISAHAQVGDLPRSSPEAQGVSSARIAAFLDSVMAIPDAEVHHLVLLRHGSVIAELHPRPFLPTDGHTLFSCSKTFVAAAVGIAVGEGRLKVSDKVISFFPDELPDCVSPRLANLSVRDLLTMTSGFVPTDSVRQHSLYWVRDYLARPFAAQPGERFAYDSMDTYLLSAIIGKVAGMPLLDYLRPRLFAPLGIDSLNWESSPEGESCGGWGLYLQAESMAKFGQCLLQKGLYNGRQIIPSDWVEHMMSVHVPTIGYGYQMWTCAHPRTMRADGLHGQFIIVMPDEDMVCAITQCITAAAPGNCEQAYLFNLVCPYVSSSPLPESADYKTLKDKLSRHSIAMPSGEAKVCKLKIGEHVDILLPSDNLMGWKSLSIRQNVKSLTMTVTDTLGRIVPIECAFSEWAMSQVPTTFPSHPRGTTLWAFSGFTEPFRAAASYAWLNADELEVHVLFTDWISGFDLRVRFSADGEVRLLVKRNHDKTPFEVTGRVASNGEM